MTTGQRIGGRAKKPMNPKVRRLNNLAAFWRQRYEACGQDVGELARVSYERARAAAKRAERAGQPGLYDLAQVLTTWAERVEQAEIKRAEYTDGGHAP